MDRLVAVGFGLAHGEIRLERTTAAWLEAGEAVRNDVALILDGVAVAVELIGSASVAGLLAKPILDLAVGVSPGQLLPPVATRLEEAGWVYRGDVGDAGGHVFVVDSRPQYRVANLHVVEYRSDQWENYLRLRDLLRQSPDARASYEAVKVRLAGQPGLHRSAYTRGKNEVVSSLLRLGRRA